MNDFSELKKIETDLHTKYEFIKIDYSKKYINIGITIIKSKKQINYSCT